MTDYMPEFTTATPADIVPVEGNTIDVSMSEPVPATYEDPDAAGYDFAPSGLYDVRQNFPGHTITQLDDGRYQVQLGHMVEVLDNLHDLNMAARRQQWLAEQGKHV